MGQERNRTEGTYTLYVIQMRAEDAGLQGQGLGAFHDIERLTMFADYRVPVVLRQLGILQYSGQLASKVTQASINLIGLGFRSAFCVQHCQSQGSPLSVQSIIRTLAHPHLRNSWHGTQKMCRLSPSTPMGNVTPAPACYGPLKSLHRSK